MGNTFVEKHILRIARNLIILGIVIIGIGAFFISFNVLFRYTPAARSICEAVICLIGIILFIIGLYWWINPGQHQACRKLSSFGELWTVLKQIHNEVISSSTIKPAKGFFFTKQWLIFVSLFKVKVIPLSTIVWVFQFNVQHHHYGIPTGKSYAIWIYAEDGSHDVLNCAREKDVDAVLIAFQQHVPWAIYGYPEWIRQEWSVLIEWKKNRVNILQSVKQRHEKMQ